MATNLTVQITPQGIFIPNAAIVNWGKIEILKEKDRIVIQPKFPLPERERGTQALEEAGLLYETQTTPALPNLPAKVVRPHARQLRSLIIAKMKAVGLIEDLPWPQPPKVSPEERASLAKKLSYGKPLSEAIIEDREARV